MNIRAVQFLEDRLAAGPVPSNELYEEGAKYGLSMRTLLRAAKHAGPAGADQRKSSYDGPWEWFLLEPIPVTIRGRQIYPHKTYRKNGKEILGADYIAAYRAYLLNNNGVDPKA